MSVFDWSLTAGTNASADAAINWVEGQLPNTVNNSARAMMAAISAYIKDSGGYAVLGGSGDTFTLTLTQTMATEVPGLVGFFATRTNTGAVTLNIDGTGANPLRAVSGTALAAGQIKNGAFYIVTWNSSTSEWIITGSFALGLTDLPSVANSTILSNISGGSATPSANTVDNVLAVASNSVRNAGLRQMPTSSFKGNFSGESAVNSGTVTISSASPAVVSWTTHGLSAGQPVYFTLSGTGALSLLTGVQADRVYYVQSTGLTADSFRISATEGGSDVNTSGSTTGTITATAPAIDPPIDMPTAYAQRILLNETVRADTGTSYEVNMLDRFSLRTFSNASAVGVTLPTATSASGLYGPGVWFEFQNVGTATVTITPTTSTIDGASTLTLPAGYGVKVLSDGTNYQLAGSVNPIKGRVKLYSEAASTSAFIGSTSVLTSTWRYYDIILENIVPATNACDLLFQVYHTSAWQTGTYVASGTLLYPSTPSSLGSVTNGVRLNNLNQVANSAPGMSGTINLSNPSQTAARKMINAQVAYNGTVSPPHSVIASGYQNTDNSALTGCRIIASTGNITSGTIAIYGYN